MKILKANTGLDTERLLDSFLGSGFDIRDFDAAAPLIDQVADVDVILLRDTPITAEVIDAAPELKLLQRWGPHIVGVDIQHARAKDIHVARVPAEVIGSSRVVAEHAFFLMLALAKRYNEARTSIRTQKVGVPRTYMLKGKTLGLVGVGNTGKELAKLAAAFDMRVIAIKRTADSSLAQELGLEFLGNMSSKEYVLGQSDFVSIHLPLEEATVGFFGEEELSQMKSGSYLVNISRGRIVDRNGLYEALTGGTLAGAGLDVFWEEPVDPSDSLLMLDSVIATPHIAAPTYETQELGVAVVGENVRLVGNGEVPKYLVQ